MENICDRSQDTIWRCWKGGKRINMAREQQMLASRERDEKPLTLGKRRRWIKKEKEEKEREERKSISSKVRGFWPRDREMLVYVFVCFSISVSIHISISFSVKDAFTQKFLVSISLPRSFFTLLLTLLLHHCLLVASVSCNLKFFICAGWMRRREAWMPKI